MIELNNQRQKVCKNAFLQLYQIKKIRLILKMQNNCEISEDIRGKHENQWNKLSQQVLDDVIDFIKTFLLTWKYRKFLKTLSNSSANIKVSFLMIFSLFQKAKYKDFLEVIFVLNVKFSTLKLKL